MYIDFVFECIFTTEGRYNGTGGQREETREPHYKMKKHKKIKIKMILNYCNPQDFKKTKTQ